jgi:hypothetical protein
MRTITILIAIYLLFDSIMRRKFEYFDGFESYNFINRNSSNKLDIKSLKRKCSKFILKRNSISNAPNWFK